MIIINFWGVQGAHQLIRLYGANQVYDLGECTSKLLKCSALNSCADPARNKDSKRKYVELSESRRTKRLFKIRQKIC